MRLELVTYQGNITILPLPHLLAVYWHECNKNVSCVAILKVVVESDMDDIFVHPGQVSLHNL